MLLWCGSTNGERVATSGISNDLSHFPLTVGVDINGDCLRSQAKMLKPYNNLSPGCFDIFSNHHIANAPRHHLSQHKDLHWTWKFICNDLTCCVEECKISLNWNLFPVTFVSSVLKDGTTLGTLQTIRIEWNMSLSPVTCQFTVVSSRHSCNRKVMSVTHPSSQTCMHYYYQHLDTNEPKDNWQNMQRQDNAFQAFHETNQNLSDLVWISIPNLPMR